VVSLAFRMILHILFACVKPHLLTFTFTETFTEISRD